MVMFGEVNVELLCECMCLSDFISDFAATEPKQVYTNI